MISKESEKKLQRLKHDFEYYAPKMLKIRTKEGQLIPFQFNKMQLKIDAEIERQRALGKPVRIVILKYRQGGASTYTEGRIFHSTSMNDFTNSLIVAHEDDASTNLFNISKLYYENLPELLKPPKKASNAKEVIFDRSESTKQGLGSRIKIATANNMGAGRSSTTHNLHASEVAFWRDGKTIMLGLMQAVPNTPNTMVILESTANGVGGYFYDEWQRAKNGESDFVALFFAWFEEPQYEMDVPADFVLTPEEVSLKQQYPLITDRKLVWRRWCIANNCGGDAELFKQEYPSNDVEAFITSGRPRFDIPVLMEYLAQCQEGQRGYLERSGGKVQFIPDAKGYLEVWKRPNGDNEYYTGADVAKGLATGDYSAAPTFSNGYDLCALWHGHIDPDLFAGELNKMGTWYGESLIAVEENNHGLTVLNSLKNDYYNLYKRTNHNRITDETKEELGWWTSDQTKKLAIDNLARLMRERKLWIKSKKFIQELMTYVIGDDGKTNAQQGSHDDTVMSAAIILYVMEQEATPVTGIVQAATPILSDGPKSDFTMTEHGFRHKSEVPQDDESDWYQKAGW